jgi:hypothetical protein
MALATSELDRCAICHRHFLQGEAIRLFREPQSRAMQRVCPLCTSPAGHRGWELCEATREIPLRAHGDPARQEQAMQRDRLVERLQDQLEGVQRERDGVRREGEKRADELAAELERVSAALRKESQDLTATRSQLRDAQAHGRQTAEMQDRRLERAERRQRELEGELAESHAEMDRILRARRREADVAYLRRVAAEAFNRSPHASEVSALSRSQGDPRCRLTVEAVGLPRRVRVILAWKSETRVYRVDLDLVERTATVDALRGEHPDAASLQANAAWTPANGVIADP